MSSARGFRPPSLNELDLKNLLVQALDDAPRWQSQETFHARFDHLERGLSMDDVIHGLRGSWKFERPPEFNDAEWQWKYRIATQTIEGDPLTIVVAVDTTNRSFEVLTRW
jgi:hypothetical protein